MRLNRVRTSALATLVVGLAFLTVAFFAFPQSAASQEAAAQGHCIGCSVDGKTTPRMADGHPDFSGFWNGGVAGAAPAAAAGDLNDGAGQKIVQGGNRQLERARDGSILFDFGADIENQQICTDDSCQASNQPPYNAEYMAKAKAIAATFFGGTTPLDPMTVCKPEGVPRSAGAMQIVQNKDVVAILYEGVPYSTFRLIYTDGRGHTDDPDPTYFGESVGHWEGDTLVVDVIGLNDETWLGGGGGGRTRLTTLHSDKEHVVERWTRNGDVLTYQATVDDPEAFTKPWVLPSRRVRIADSGDSLFEMGCTPDNSHFVKPNPEDKDIKNKCAFLCGESDATGYQPKQNK